MVWYDNLYVGESIGKKKDKVIRKIRQNAGQIGIYVISIASNKSNLLDIIPATDLLFKAYPKKQIFVLGIAKGYDEAVEVAASIIDEVYRNTGDFSVRSYFRDKVSVGEA
jgi:hypothetical protein